MNVASYLLGQTRSSVLSALLLHPERSVHVRELARLTHTSAGSLHRDLRALSQAGLLLRESVGRQVHYRANVDHPIFSDLASLLRRTSGLADVLRDALAPLGPAIRQAFIYGSQANDRVHAHSDVDVMIVGDLSFADAVAALAPAQAVIRREINPTVMSGEEFARRLDGEDAFTQGIWTGPKIWLLGQPSGAAP